MYLFIAFVKLDYYSEMSWVESIKQNSYWSFMIVATFDPFDPIFATPVLKTSHNTHHLCNKIIWVYFCSQYARIGIKSLNFASSFRKSWLVKCTPWTYLTWPWQRRPYSKLYNIFFKIKYQWRKMSTKVTFFVVPFKNIQSILLSACLYYISILISISSFDVCKSKALLWVMSVIRSTGSTT